jgi:GT2 family glycosyltransferase/glycosyltransferase involved in cell wall biosynthesis
MSKTEMELVEDLQNTEITGERPKRVRDRSPKISSDQIAVDAPPPNQFRLLGYVEGVNSEAISGWACNAANLTEFVQVDVQIDGAAVGAIIADRPRPDVAEAGAGHSHCGFLFELPPALKDGKQHEVVCLVSGHILPMGDNHRTGTVFEKEFKLSGYLDSIHGHAISGWACNAADQHEFVNVDIRIDGVSVGTVVADSPRKDVADAGFGHNSCGFFWPVPASLKDGKRHDVACFVSGRALSMPAAVSKGVYFAVSALGLFPLGRPKHFTHILSGDAGMPDFFRVRSAAAPSKSVIVALIDTPEGWSDFDQKAASGALENFDVLIALREKHFINAFHSDFQQFNDFSLVEYASRIGSAGIFQHIIDSSILFEYERIVFLNYADDTFARDERIDGLVNAANSEDVGVIAGEVTSYGKFRTPEIQRFLNIVLPRLGCSVPQADFPVPVGSSLYINPLILRQFTALKISLTDLTGGDKEDKTRWYSKALALLGYFSYEGDLSVQVGKPDQAGILSADSAVQRTIKVIAFLLPQFHPVKENDQWWGRGFTEWNNVIRGRPLFRFHYQPRLPKDLGFYDLRHPDTQKHQAKLARDHGVYGFCYYYYWFDGKKMLNEPIEQMLKSGSPDHPFCVCWANENWSRNWDGQERFVLLKQHYSMASHRTLILEFIEMMRDRRYIRHNGKPVLVVYRIRVIPNWLEVAAMWREECRKAGIGEIHLCAVRFGLEPLDGPPAEVGLDSYVMFPPHETVREDVRDKVLDLDSKFRGEIFSYDGVTHGDLTRFKDNYPWPVHRGAMMGWDNTARRLTDSRIFQGATPLKFRKWMKGIVEQEITHNPDKESLLFINAWNEWAEGSALEPDQKFGDSYLRAVRSTVSKHTPIWRTRSAVEQALLELKPAARTPEFAPTARSTAGNRPVAHVGAIANRTGRPTVMLCAHVAGHQLYGGERSFLDVIYALSKTDYNIIVCLPSANNKAYVEEIKQVTHAVYTFNYAQWYGRREIDQYVVLNFSDIIAAHNVSLVYANTIVLLEPLVAAKRMKRARLIHARELISLDAPLQERMKMTAEEIISEVFTHSDFIIANSRATYNLFLRQDRTFYLPNATRVEDFSFPNVVEARIRFGIVSSNLPKKGVADFIKIAQLCQSKAQNAEFVVIGPDNKHVEDWKKDKSLPSNLKFLGYRESPVEAMKEMNVLLSLSNFAESFGRTVTEAMAASRPVIAYEWGAVPEHIDDGVTGFLVPYRNTEAAAQAVLRFCENPSMIRDMGIKGRAIVVERYSYKCLQRGIEDTMAVIFDQYTVNQAVFPFWNHTMSAAPDVTIVIPVYNAHDEVADCIKSVLSHTNIDRIKLLIINDGSTDERIPVLLNRYLGTKNVEILHNDGNIGYTKTINRGIAHAGSDDVILLNSDAVVTPNWFAGLRAAAFMGPKVGTVTAMSDNAGAFSFPVIGEKNLVPNNIARDDFAIRIVQAAKYCEPVEVPTGSGFCMYISRQLMDEIGTFDEKAFSRGYGEENDFCMRAMTAGWKNVITPWSYVYHVRTASFKADKEALVAMGIKVVTSRYPKYATLVKAAFASDPMQALRKATQQAFPGA